MHSSWAAALLLPLLLLAQASAATNVIRIQLGKQQPVTAAKGALTYEDGDVPLINYLDAQVCAQQRLTVCSLHCSLSILLSNKSQYHT